MDFDEIIDINSVPNDSNPAAAAPGLPDFGVSGSDFFSGLKGTLGQYLDFALKKETIESQRQMTQLNRQATINGPLQVSSAQQQQMFKLLMMGAVIFGVLKLTKVV